MAANRTEKLQRLHKALKKHYGPPPAPPDRSLLEHLMYACCLEDSLHEKCEEVFARLQSLFVDWNEVRVTTVSELSEVMEGLYHPAAAATRLKQLLQGVFETHYAFDLESLKKQNLGKACKELEKYPGVTHYAVAYANQHALGGHSIPLDNGVLQSLLVLGVIGETDVKKAHVPGLERSVAKNKGVEFGYLLHQLGADFLAAPFSSKVRTLFTDIEPESRSRLPKRIAKQEQNGENMRNEENSEAPSQRKSSAKSSKKAASLNTGPNKKTAEKSASPRRQSTKKSESDSESAKTVRAKKKTTSKGLTRKKPK